MRETLKHVFKGGTIQIWRGDSNSEILTLIILTW